MQIDKQIRNSFEANVKAGKFRISDNMETQEGIQELKVKYEKLLEFVLEIARLDWTEDYLKEMYKNYGFNIEEKIEARKLLKEIGELNEA